MNARPKTDLTRIDGTPGQRIEGSHYHSWDDGWSTVSITFQSSNTTWQLIDLADDMVLAKDAITSGHPLTKEQVSRWMEKAGQLRRAVDAIDEELLLIAREADPDRGGRALMTWDELAGPSEKNRITVSDRYKKIAGGAFAAWRKWLVQGTPREWMY